MKPMVIASNMLNEIDQVESWYYNMTQIADVGIVIVDTGSTDGTIEFFKDKRNVVLIVDNTIQREGYGNARNQLMALSREHYPEAHWMAFFDADERISSSEFHRFRHIKDYLIDIYDVVAFPRIDWIDKDMSAAVKDYHTQPDYQARMVRLDSHVRYVRKLHEQIQGHKGIYADLQTPKINHFHRATGQEKRNAVGKVCAKLHAEDSEYGHTYPEHHKEAYYREMIEKEGL